ncbi:hypothetical protein K491DRAFT_664286 [Lophiostoma macrostomum CBS 122681]|uniref:Mediator of RNA polymerase II transcription subunit 20 n=1 Tax=Lophiostoma macrostomum CBS 122681 TaxID=1314788 RepID=A0A6A6T0Y4_9PLEO|nr:hypothetical protein K491DRAFT_664286 [Lophiostoma macrostomum CBS 122681]
MKYSGLYFIPAHANASEASSTIFHSLTESIERQFSTTSPQNFWTLQHRLLRSNAASNATPAPIKPEPTNPSIKPEPTSAAPTPTANPQPSTSSDKLISITPQSQGTLITIPSAQTESHFAFLTNKLSPLWQFRHALQIPHGVVYNIGQFTIHMGEMKANRPSGSGGSGNLSPGVVVCVSTEIGEGSDGDVRMGNDGYMALNGDAMEGIRGDGEDREGEEEVDVSDAEDLIRDVWRTMRTDIDFGKAEVREVMLGKEGVNETQQSEATVVRMWCEVLRLRG